MNTPKIVIHQTASLDGKLSAAPGVLLLFGDERWQAVAGQGEDAYRKSRQLYQPQAILEGSGSFVTDAVSGFGEDAVSAFGEDAVFGEDAASLETGDELYQDYLPRAVVEAPGRRWFTAVDGRGRVLWAYKEFPGEDWLGWHLLVLAHYQTPPGYLAYLRRESIPYLVAGGGQVDLAAAFEKMACLLGVSTILSTAGGRLNGALLKAGLVDELLVDFFPALIGGRDTPSLFDVPPLQAGELPVSLELISAAPQPNGWVELRYRVLKP
jgi:2,5-diamino-6-(ribosylamino)-4(3H)-pyrimidinone 5'-phosphate reductase